jgi:hypothetical protein
LLKKTPQGSNALIAARDIVELKIYLSLITMLAKDYLPLTSTRVSLLYNLMDQFLDLSPELVTSKHFKNIRRSNLILMNVKRCHPLDLITEVTPLIIINLNSTKENITNKINSKVRIYKFQISLRMSEKVPLINKIWSMHIKTISHQLVYRYQMYQQTIN